MKSNKVHQLSLIVVFFILVALLTMAFGLRYRNYVKSLDGGKVPDVVTRLLTDYMEANVFSGVVDAFPFEDYIEGARPQTTDFHEGMTEETNAFYVTLVVGYGDRESYTLTPVVNGFSIIRFYDSEGDLVAPLVGFWYEVVNGKIQSYRLSKIQPFSTLDPEYSEVLGQ